MSVIAVLALFLGGGLALCHSVVCFVFGSLDGFLACFRLFFFGEFNMVIDYHFTVYRLAYQDWIEFLKDTDTCILLCISGRW